MMKKQHTATAIVFGVLSLNVLWLTPIFEELHIWGDNQAMNIATSLCFALAVTGGLAYMSGRIATSGHFRLPLGLISGVLILGITWLVGSYIDATYGGTLKTHLGATTFTWLARLVASLGELSVLGVMIARAGVIKDAEDAETTADDLEKKSLELARAEKARAEMKAERDEALRQVATRETRGTWKDRILDHLSTDGVEWQTAHQISEAVGGTLAQVRGPLSLLESDESGVGSGKIAGVKSWAAPGPDGMRPEVPEPPLPFAGATS